MKQLCIRSLLVMAIGASGCAVGSGDGLGNSQDVRPTKAIDGGDRTRIDAGSSQVVPRSPTGSIATEDAGPEDAATPAVDAAPDSPGPTEGCSFTGKLVTFDLSTIGGSSDLTPRSHAPGLTVTPLTRVGVTAVSSSGAMNASSWPTGDADSSKHYTFSVRPPSGCALTLASLAIDLRASNTGPEMAAVGTSADSYATLEAFPVSTAGGTKVVPLSGIHSVEDALEIHVYGFAASSSAGTLRIQNELTLIGSLSHSSSAP